MEHRTKLLTEAENRSIGIIKEAAYTVLHNAERAHDYWHAYRVDSTARSIHSHEGGSLLVISAAAWLHDIIDEKISSHPRPLEFVHHILASAAITNTDAEHILRIISNLSFAQSFDAAQEVSSLEHAIVRDADRLDAIGAIGIARAFQYGGFKNRLMYSPHELPQNYTSKAEYRNSKSHTINHFHEKLLHIHTTLITPTAKIMAQPRVKRMEDFVAAFIAEWNATEEQL